MTREQRRTLEAVRTYYHRHHLPPTVRQIQADLGMKSTSGIFLQLQALARDGFLIRTERGKFIPAEKCPCCGRDWGTP